MEVLKPPHGQFEKEIRQLFKSSPVKFVAATKRTSEDEAANRSAPPSKRIRLEASPNTTPTKMTNGTISNTKNGQVNGAESSKGSPKGTSSAEQDSEARWARALNAASINLRWQSNQDGPQFASQGLQNEGNACYMNSTLQALFHNPLLAQFIRQHPVNACDRNHCVACALNRLQSSYWQIGSSKGNMRSFREAARRNLQKVMNRHVKFNVHNQQDSDEMYRAMLDTMKTQLKRTATLIDAVSGTLELENKAYCPVDGCKYIHKNKEIADSLTVQFPRPARDMDLIEMIERRLAPDIRQVSCGNKACKTSKSPGTRRKYHQTIRSAPDVLYVHILRFQKGMGMGAVKLKNKVRFEETLDLTSMYRYGKGQKLVYELYAIVYHAGSLHGGHYIAAAKDASQKWHIINDSAVIPVSKSEALNQGKGFEPYQLFYLRRKPEESVPGQAMAKL